MSIFLIFSASLLYLGNAAIGLGLILIFSALSFLPAILVKRENRLRLSSSVIPSLRKGIPLFLTFLAIFIAISVSLERSTVSFEDIIGRDLFDTGFRFFRTWTNRTDLLPFPIPDPDRTVDEAILDSIFNSPGQSDLATAIPSQEIDEILRQSRRELSEALGVEVRGDMKVGDVLYPYSVSEAEKTFEPLKNYYVGRNKNKILGKR